MILRGRLNNEENILDYIQKEGLFISAACGGRGTCGKCRVRFLENAPSPSDADLERLKPEELEAGFRLACKASADGDFVIEFDQSEEEIHAESIDIGNNKEQGDSGDNLQNLQLSSETVVAVDIGTTTIAAALIQGGKVVNAVTSINHQRAFGADVISRIQASNEGNGAQLKELVETDIRNLVSKLGADPDSIKIIISGNTTMEHLLLGYSCETLGVVPFTPVDISLHESGNYTVLPGISTYVGADIVSGIVNTGMDQSDDVCFLIDLGTNGEMAVGNKDKIMVASTAAGPAFEGVNISCGVAGVPGAISHIDIDGEEISFETIDDKAPCGICGSGVIEITHELLKTEVIDETGRMEDEYMEKGFQICEGVVFTDKDVREVQLAKAAIRAGLETLLEEYGIGYDQVKKLYLAGGFGQKIDLYKTAGIGLLPEELVECTEAVGNTSLYGAIQFVTEEGSKERFERAVSISEEVRLSDNPTFQEYYMDYMFFE